MADTPRPRGRPKGFHHKPAQNVIQALDRALDVMDTLSNSGGMTLSEIAAEMEQSPATIYRVLTTLELRGMVEMDAVTQSWHIGPMTFQMGSAFLRRSNVVERSRPVMRWLMQVTGETSNLGVEKSGLVMFLSQVETHEAIRAFFPPGTLSPMHASGIGKALLAHLPEDRWPAVLEQFTPKTITDHETLGAEMAQIRFQGFAFDNEEKAAGMRCIAAPIFNVHGEAVAGISVSGPSNRITLENVAGISQQVVQAAAEVSQMLGAG